MPLSAAGQVADTPAQHDDLLIACLQIRFQLLDALIGCLCLSQLFLREIMEEEVRQSSNSKTLIRDGEHPGGGRMLVDGLHRIHDVCVG